MKYHARTHARTQASAAASVAIDGVCAAAQRQASSMPTSRQDRFEGAEAPVPTTSCAVVPQRTGDPERARELFARDGAVIWTGGSGTGFDDAATVPADVFGSVRSLLPPIKICYGNGVVGESDVTRDGGAHTDGYAYGGAVNDAFVLLCERPCTGGGGGNFLIDAAKTAATLEREPESAWLVPELRCRAINQTSTCICTECVPDGQPLESVSPIFQTIAAPADGIFGQRVEFQGNGAAGEEPCRPERPFFRLFGDQRSLGEALEAGGPTRPASPCHPDANGSTDPAADRTMIDAFHAAMQAQGKAAERFYCEQGDALIVDNWRILHGRDRYFDKRRSLWRVWFWTEESAAVALPSNDWRLTHLDADEAALAARRDAGYDPRAIAAAIPTPSAHDAML
jgi:hypothetical protein